jgi:tol-pal system protein YbgF
MKRPSVFPVAALFMLFAFSGCAGKGAGTWSQDKPLIMESIRQTHAEQFSMKTELKAMERRLLELEKTVKKQEAENRALAASLQSLRKKNSRKKLSSRVASKDQKLVRKLQKIESSIRSAATKGTSVIQPSDKSIEKNSYTAAYLALKSGRYEEASIGFKSLLKKHPQGEYADQAYFWLGESYFTQRKMKEAIAAFKKVANDYPGSAKHPAALLRLAAAYQETGRRGDAKAVLQRLIRQHPESNAAEQARTQLKTIEAEQKK